MADTPETETPAGTPTGASAPAAGDAGGKATADRGTTRLAGRIRAFAAEHGGSADASIAHLGVSGYRLVLVGADGAWGDVVTDERERALAAAALAGVTVHEAFDGEMASRVRTGPYEWSRMAGSQIGGPANPSADTPTGTSGTP
ncbi:hypothetical protein [Streptomyces sp. ST2-7A]|uniref:hypothetical protein n=1 Tax=Streptomyces sp. ST2-7A TaxID=2907214 RepID=UPI0027E22411|nr:hypothetical protein [Streptomyces sp. ST2-7A]